MPNSRRLAVAVVVAFASLCAHAAAAPLHFAPPVYVDADEAGGEPVLIADRQHGTLVYSTHAGTTHLYRPGFASAVTFASTYRNQVFIWTSADGGATWKRTEAAAGFGTNPATNQGFSDPDLTQDAGGRIYNTGIDLANDSLFSSGDGGRTFDRGTAQCHDGDRPWLAGAKPDEVFLATNTSEGALSHQIFESTDGGVTCTQSGIPDARTLPSGESYTGNGKLYYDRKGDRLIEPVNFADADGKVTGVGVGTWKRGDAAFVPHKIADTSQYAHWPAIALDDGGAVHAVWDDDPRAPGTAGGCDGSATPVANRISMASSSDFGAHWTAPAVVAEPAGARVFWPWIAAGDPGKVSVVWYQTDKVVDLACQDADISVRTATISGAGTGTPVVSAADAAGRPISHNNICQSGTTCVATGEDRRLGDFFTNAVDADGCVIIGTGDTMRKDPMGNQLITSRPLFLRQDGGPRLRGSGDCGQPASVPLGLPAPACRSRRNFRIRLRTRRSDPLRTAAVYVNGKRVRVLRGKRLRSRVDLRGLPKGTFKVRIVGRTRSGRRVAETRTYHTCVPRT